MELDPSGPTTALGLYRTEQRWRRSYITMARGLVRPQEVSRMNKLGKALGFVAAVLMLVLAARITFTGMASIQRTKSASSQATT